MVHRLSEFDVDLDTRNGAMEVALLFVEQPQVPAIDCFRCALADLPVNRQSLLICVDSCDNIAQPLAGDAKISQRRAGAPQIADFLSDRELLLKAGDRLGVGSQAKIGTTQVGQCVTLGPPIANAAQNF